MCRYAAGSRQAPLACLQRAALRAGHRLQAEELAVGSSQRRQLPLTPASLLLLLPLLSERSRASRRSCRRPLLLLLLLALLCSQRRRLLVLSNLAVPEKKAGRGRGHGRGSEGTGESRQGAVAWWGSCGRRWAAGAAEHGPVGLPPRLPPPPAASRRRPRCAAMQLTTRWAGGTPHTAGAVRRGKPAGRSRAASKRSSRALR